MTASSLRIFIDRLSVKEDDKRITGFENHLQVIHCIIEVMIITKYALFQILNNLSEQHKCKITEAKKTENVSKNRCCDKLPSMSLCICTSSYSECVKNFSYPLLSVILSSHLNF